MSKFCQSCGKELDDEARYCNACGAAQSSQQSSQQNGQQSAAGGEVPPSGSGAAYAANEVFSKDDIEKNKVVAGLAYLIFFLPLIACPDSAFGRFHANQGLLLLIASVGLGIALGILPFLWVIGWIFYIGIFVFAIMGLVNGLNGKAKELPLIGKYRILR